MLEVKQALTFPEEVDNSASVEFQINQHFVYLHGILQNLEDQMIEILHSQRNSRLRNLIEIQEELQSLETQLQNGILLTNLAESQSESVIQLDVVEAVKELFNIPCHVVKHEIVDKNAESIKFYTDPSFIEVMKNHCSVTVQPFTNQYSLMTADKLPEDYVIATVDRESLPIPALLAPPLQEHSSAAVDPVLETSVVSASTSTQSLVETDSRKGYEVHVTYIGNPYCFYVRKKDDDHLYVEIQRELAKYDNMNDMLPEEIKEGEIYVVQDSIRRWFRGRVQSSTSKSFHQTDTYQIFAIDYGFIAAKVNGSKLRKIVPKLAEIPPLAQKHRLFDIYPINGKLWSKESVESMRKIVASSKDKLPKVYEVNHDSKIGCDLLMPTTIYNDPMSVRDTLLFLGHGKFITTEKLFRINPSASNAYHHEELDMDKYYDIVCLNIESPLCFYVRKADYNESYFQKMISEMTTTYQKTKKLKSLIYNPSIGMNCAVPFAGSWHRGVVSNIPGNKIIEVFLVDLGVKTTMIYKKIRRLDPSFTVAIVRAIKISLKDVTIPDDGWRPNTANIMADFMNPTAQMIISSKTDDCYIASILNYNNISLSNALDAKCFTENNIRCVSPSPLNSLTNSSKKKNKSHTKKKSNNNCPIIINDKNKTLTQKTTSVNMRRSKQDEDPYRCCVNVVRVVSPDEIYLATTNRTDTFDEIHDKIQKFYSKQRAIVAPDMSQGAMCVVRLSTNNAYYRAKIIDAEDDNVKVFLIDEGKYETVSKDSIQSLADQLHDIPAYLFKVRLAGIYPTCGKTTWTSVTCDKLIEIVNANENRNFYIAKVGETVNEAMTVDLYVEQANIIDAVSPTVIEISSVNRMLVEAGLALPIKNYNDNKLKILAVDIKKEMNFHDGSATMADDNEIIQENNINTMVDPDDFTLDPPKRITNCFPPNIPTWLPPDPIIKDSFYARITYIDWDGFVYLHPIDRSAELKSLDQKINNHFKFKKLNTDVTWKPGDMCIASCTINSWCRGIVHKVLEKHIAVEFVDYGNLEWEIPSVLSKELMLTNVPCMASKCQIYGLISATPNGTWNSTELTQLHSTLVDKVSNVTILRKKDDYYIIQINTIENVTENFFGYLVEKFHMNLLQSFDRNFESDAESECSADIYPEIDDQNDDTSADVIVEGILEDNTDDNLEVDEMNINSNELAENFAGSVAKSIDFNGEVINVSPDEFIVQNTIKNILDSVVAKHKKYAEPSNLLADDTTDSEKEFSNESYVEDDDDVDFINTDGYYALRPINSKINQSHLPVKTDLIFKSIPQLFDNKGKYEQLNLPNDVTEFPAAIGDIDKEQSNIVWLHPSETKDHSFLNIYRKAYIATQLKMELEADEQPLLDNFDSGTPCCAKYKDVWHRGQIVSSVKLAGMIEVLYVDWGNTEWVETNELRKMKTEWFELPTLAIKCRLWNTRATHDERARNWLQFKRDHSDELYKTKVVGRESDRLIVKIFDSDNDKILMYQDLIDQEIFHRELKDNYLMNH
ncbi:hypothetical protein PV328_006343 [Microctonus aethiopoides]|uniref:Tudor domain-containing protein n=1 Tax=Microctonus aethiopoides TaxID=144406 RepID=A0AA39FNV9_9HYME|nr:hypothetical protein PV328_006343 [Microctonus aethiopoides]